MGMVSTFSATIMLEALNELMQPAFRKARREWIASVVSRRHDFTKYLASITLSC